METKEIIKSVLEDVADSQLNLSSEVARETLATLIYVAILENEKIDPKDCHHNHTDTDSHLNTFCKDCGEHL